MTADLSAVIPFCGNRLRHSSAPAQGKDMAYLLFLATFWHPSIQTGQQKSPANPAVAVHITPLQGASFDSKDIKFADAWKVTFDRNGAPVTQDAKELLTIRFAERPPLSRMRSQALLFVSGAELFGELSGLADESISFRSASLGEVKVPIGEIAAIVLEEGLADSQIAMLRTLAKTSKRQGDQIILKNRDIVAGSISAIEAANIKIKTDKDESSIARTLVSAVFFDPSLVTNEKPVDSFAEIRTMDGGVCQIKSMTTQGERLQIVLMSGATTTVRPQELVDISFQNDSVVYLSDREPKSAIHEPFLDDARPMQRNRSVVGTRLRMDGQSYRKGLGVRSRSVLEYDATGFRRFDATVGMDETSGKQGSVQFVVLLDGKQMFDSGEMTPVSAAKVVSFPLNGGKQLQLIVEYAKRGDVDDNANWCDARLVK